MKFSLDLSKPSPTDSTSTPPFCNIMSPRRPLIQTAALSKGDTATPHLPKPGIHPLPKTPLHPQHPWLNTTLFSSLFEVLREVFLGPVEGLPHGQHQHVALLQHDVPQAAPLLQAAALDGDDGGVEATSEAGLFDGTADDVCGGGDGDLGGWGRKEVGARGDEDGGFGVAMRGVEAITEAKPVSTVERLTISASGGDGNLGVCGAVAVTGVGGR